MTYTEKHLDQIDANFSRPGRNGDVPRLSQEITDDAELKEAAKDVEMLWQATRLERLQGKLEMLKEYEAKAKAEAKEDKKAKVISMGKVRLILSVAAGVLLMVSVGWYITGYDNSNTSKYIAFLDEKPLNVITQRGQSLESDLLQALTLFEMNEYDRAIQKFEEMHLPVNHSGQMYFGFCLIKKGRYTDAATVLNQYLESTSVSENFNDRYFREQSQYLLALSYILLGENTEDAKSLLTELVATSEMQDQAKALLYELQTND